ncbi:Phosphomannomutase/phosphoglucomutase [Posidoniimonas polymericola]|uniref:Phosphomannomutase/phosphoglucomutase n=1 Tax=Posidoniimonas polymericola TaxID=2528002 RepID=A0A5C5YFQ6_9BACT|nr:phosphoglucosamine mutase [Posidoniimonas polymericola]TWT73799.1 Phosphomannomutase/phosphoglucomutase [Posidoniimonas polymericola]
MDELIISVSGLRGIVGQSLTAEVAARYALAFAGALPPGPIVITRDGRSHGPMLAEAIAAALTAAGRPVLDAGPAATPTTGILVRAEQCVGGFQISASHNPPEYNGIKLFSAEGRVIPAEAGEAVRQRYLAGEAPAAPRGPGIGEEPATVETLHNTVTAHLMAIEDAVDVDLIRSKRFRVLLDANHGAGAVLGRPLLEVLGCEVTVLGAEPDGQFAHTPEPTAENLSSVLPKVTELGAAVGFCQDPDADRLALIDETGRYVGEEYTLALCVEHLLSRDPGPVVTNCSTSRMTQDIAERHAVAFHHSAVGEANVVNKMNEVQAIIGGEGNGGVIDPRIGPVRDSFIGMALTLEALATRDEPLSKLIDELPRYAIHKAKVTVTRDKIPAALDALAAHFTDAAADRTDGLRLDWQDEKKWLLVRASNTEPIVRIFCEAATAEEAKQVADEAASVMG